MVKATPASTNWHSPSIRGTASPAGSSQAFTEHQLQADREALKVHEDAGYHCHSKATIHVGDKISTGRGSWGCGEVVRVNPKTVSVTTGYSWTDKVSYEEIREVVCPHAAS